MTTSWNKKNKEKVKLSMKRYFEKHPEKKKLCNIIRTQNEKLKKLFLCQYGNNCMKCNKKLEKFKMEIHHYDYDLIEIEHLYEQFFYYTYNCNRKEAVKYLEKLLKYAKLICTDCHKKEHKHIVRNRKMII